jgi:hypothetical protein
LRGRRWCTTTVDDSDGRRRWGDDRRRGEAAALCGVANGGGGRAGVATEGGRSYRGWRRATAVGGRAAVSRRRRSWAGWSAAGLDGHAGGGAGRARGAWGGRGVRWAATSGGYQWRGAGMGRGWHDDVRGRRLLFRIEREKDRRKMLPNGDYFE